MNEIAVKLLEFARQNKISEKEWCDAIDVLYAANVDIMLDKNDSNITEQCVRLSASVIKITSERELLN